MRKAVLFLGILLLAKVSAAENRIECHHVIEGEEVGGKFETKVVFDSTTPSFVDTVKITFTGSPTKETKTTYLAKDTVCGIKVDFAKDCKVSQKLDPKFGYDFSFNCGNEITRGEIYCDEECLSATGSLATFRCEGPKVDKKISGGGLVFEGCKFTKAN